MKAMNDPTHALTEGLDALRQQFALPAEFPPAVSAAAEAAAAKPIADHVDRTSMHEREQPARDLRTLGIEPASRPPDVQERLLHGILGEHGVAHNAERKRVGLLAEAVVELAECAVVLPGAAGYKVCVRQLSMIHTTESTEPSRRRECDGDRQRHHPSFAPDPRTVRAATYLPAKTRMSYSITT